MCSPAGKADACRLADAPRRRMPARRVSRRAMLARPCLPVTPRSVARERAHQPKGCEGHVGRRHALSAFGAVAAGYEGMLCLRSDRSRPTCVECPPRSRLVCYPSAFSLSAGTNRGRGRRMFMWLARRGDCGPDACTRRAEEDLVACTCSRERPSRGRPLWASSASRCLRVSEEVRTSAVGGGCFASGRCGRTLLGARVPNAPPFVRGRHVRRPRRLPSVCVFRCMLCVRIDSPWPCCSVYVYTCIYDSQIIFEYQKWE